VGVLQYVALQLLCTAISVLLEFLDVYNAGSMSFADGYIYMAMVRSLSKKEKRPDQTGGGCVVCVAARVAACVYARARAFVYVSE
jgi:hypothetical protein